LQLIQFAESLADEGVELIVNTQPDEPFIEERVSAVTKAVSSHNVRVHTYSEFIEQDPEAPGFWDMWKNMLLDWGIRAGIDVIVASELYGKKLAELTGTKFYPYDIERQINPSKATKVRNYPFQYFKNILPEFQEYIKTRVTFFGAESTGKTTTSHVVADRLGAPWLFEYARPYLENTINEITPDSMGDIYRGQLALQKQGSKLSTTSPYIIQDTDLFSTVGYWSLPHWQKTLGECPETLIEDALANKSDLYIITKSNIPFEEDPLRYGGNVREGSDEYWLGICEKYDLNYVVLESPDLEVRMNESVQYIWDVAMVKLSYLWYDRHGL